MQFRDIKQNSLGSPSGVDSINTVDNLSPETYDRTWASTFGKMLLCDPAEGIVGSGLTIAVSKHPTIAVQIANSSLNGTPCRVTANLINAVHGYVPISNVGQHLGYILDLPFRGDSFGLRFNMTGATIKEFTQGGSAPVEIVCYRRPERINSVGANKKGKRMAANPEF